MGVTTKDAAISALEDKLAALEKLVGGGSSADDIANEFAAVRDAIVSVEAAMDAERSRIDAMFAKADARYDELAATVAALKSPPRPLPGPDAPGASCGNGGAACIPEISTGGDSGLNLELTTPAGSVVVNTPYCSSIDLCDMSRDVEALMNKFGA